MKDVHLVRLTTGEELLCQITKDTNTLLFVKEPVQLIPTSEGKIGFAPYLAYCSIDELPIKVEHIMFIVTPEPGLVDKYKSMIGALPEIDEGMQKIIV